MRPIKRNREKYEQAANEYRQDPNCTLTYLANKYHLDRGYISKYLRSLGIKVTKKYRTKEFADELNAAIDHYVTTGDSIITTTNQYNVDRRTLQLRLKQLGLTRNGHNVIHYDVFDDYFETIDSSEKAYWFGFLLADGCIRFQSRSAQITLELANQDYLHLQKFKEALGFTGPIISRKNRQISCVRITRLKMATDLANKGCVQGKTHNGWIDIPSVIDFKSDFVRGYCDGNGFIDKKRNRIIFAMGSLGICEGLCQLLQEYNASMSTYSKLSGAGNPTTYRVNIERKSSFYQFLEDIYLNATVYLNRKMLTALQRLDAHYGQLLSEDHRTIMRNIAETTCRGESETEGSAIK